MSALVDDLARASRHYFRCRAELVLAARARHGVHVDPVHLRREPFAAIVQRYRAAGRAWRDAAEALLDAGGPPLLVDREAERARRLIFEGEFLLSRDSVSAEIRAALLPPARG